jgi:hypothetical protein
MLHKNTKYLLSKYFTLLYKYPLNAEMHFIILSIKYSVAWKKITQLSLILILYYCKSISTL